MATRTVTVTLNAAVGGFVSGMNTAAQAAQNLSQRLEQGSQHRQAWDQVGSTMTRVGAVAAAGLGAAAKAAIDWESAFAGVKKTVDGSPQQIAALEGELRNMAKTMATSHADIASVAEAAGQLGVATEDVADFSRTMIMLGETTNMSADEAATSMAQLMTIMGTAPSQVDNLGAALAGLGNNSATTESQILQMSQRIAGAGTAIGLTEADVMGFSAAIASTGVEVEAGGTAISTTMLKMEQAVRAGGRELDILAQAAGMSGAEFKRAFEDDAAQAINAFVEGLGRVGQEGGDVTAILSDLGITGIREADTLRRLANAGTLLGDSLAMAGDEFSRGSALMDEYGQRAETTESKIRVAWNNIVDAGITMGGALLPVVADAAQGMAGLAESFGSLPGPAQNAAVGIAAVVAAGGLVVGGLMKGVTAAVDFSASMSTLAESSPRAAGALRGVAKAAGVAAAAFAGLSVVIAVAKEFQEPAALSGVASMRNALEGVAQSAPGATANLDRFFQTASGEAVAQGNVFRRGVDDMSSALDRFFNKSRYERASDATDALFGVTSAAAHAAAAFADMDAALVQMQTQDAATAFREIRAEAEELNIPMEQLLTVFPQYHAQLTEVATAMGVTGLSAQDYADWMGGKIPDAVLRAAAASEQHASVLEAATGSMEAAARTAREFAVEAAASTPQAEAMANALREIPPMTEATIFTTDMAPMTMQAQDLKAKLEELPPEKIITVQLPNGEVVTGSVAEIQAGIERIEDEKAIWFSTPGGMEAVDEITKLSMAIAMAPDDKAINISAPGMGDVEGSINDLTWAIEGLPDEHQVTITMPNGAVVQTTAGAIRAAVDQIPAEKDILLQTIADLGGQQEVAAAVEGTDGKIVTVGTVADLNGQVTAQIGIDSTTGKTVIVGTQEDLSGQRRAQVAVDATTGKTVWVRTEADLGAVARARAEIARLNNRTVYITTVHRTVGVTSRDAFGGPTRADGGIIPHWSGPLPDGFAGAQRLASGGPVAGWSPHSRADNIPVRATAGEFMQPVATVQMYGLDAMEAFRTRRINPQAFAAFMNAQGLADGGPVRYAPPLPAQSQTAGKVVNQYFTYNYPVGERESTATRRSASNAALAAIS